MNNTEKLLRAFIDASGYDVEEIESQESVILPHISGHISVDCVDYKVTKRNAFGGTAFTPLGLGPHGEHNG